MEIGAAPCPHPRFLGLGLQPRLFWFDPRPSRCYRDVPVRGGGAMGWMRWNSGNREPDYDDVVLRITVLEGEYVLGWEGEIELGPTDPALLERIRLTPPSSQTKGLVDIGASIGR